jgi:hypothetical protein
MPTASAPKHSQSSIPNVLPLKYFANILSPTKMEGIMMKAIPRAIINSLLYASAMVVAFWQYHRATATVKLSIGLTVYRTEQR